MPTKMVPTEALEYLKKKSLKPAFSYRDVWNEEHASGFTVAKAMQTDVLADIKDAVKKAVTEGQTFDSFRKNLRPTLQSKGWWGRKDMVDPVTGETVNAQLGSNRRLKTIYDTNLGQAYSAGREQRGMASTSHPYAMYNLGPSRNHRPDHAQWSGLVLPKDDPWWNTHTPKNGWGCKCYKRFISERKFQEYKQNGYPVAPGLDASGGGNFPIKTERPRTKYITFVDKRTGRIERVPEGITPGFGWNPGAVGRELPLMTEYLKKGRATFPAQFDQMAQSIMRNTIKQEQFSSFVDGALANTIKGDYMTAAGFMDSTTVDWLLKNQGTDLGEGTVIGLQARLLNGVKALRHGTDGNALTTKEWKELIDQLLTANIFLDDGNLIYLSDVAQNKTVKIVVNPKYDLGSHGSAIKGPLITSAYIAAIEEVARIRKLPQIR